MKNDAVSGRRDDTVKRLFLRVAASPCLHVAVLLLPVRLYADDLAENQARFGQVSGDVQVLTQGAADWVEARTDMPIEVGDEIRVGDDSEAELPVSENVLWTLGANTDLIVGRTTMQEGHLSISRGVLRGKVETSTHRIGTWEFETPVAVCAVRGTEFALTHSAEDGTHLGVFKGTVALRQAETATQTFSPVMIGAHEEGVSKKRMPIQKLTAFSPLIQAQARELPRLQKRFRETSGVWTPLTAAYRKELRLKLVPAVKRQKPLLRRSAPRRRVLH